MTAGRERIDTKARRLLSHGRVLLLLVEPHEVFAEVRGDGATYDVSFGRGGWLCTCPARTLCSHQLAVRTVTKPTSQGGVHP